MVIRGLLSAVRYQGKNATQLNNPLILTPAFVRPIAVNDVADTDERWTATTPALLSRGVAITIGAALNATGKLTVTVPPLDPVV